MVSYTTGADTGEKLIQNLSGLEDNVIYAEQKITGKAGTASDYQDFLYTKDIQGSTSSILNKDTKGELSYEYDDFGETSIHGSSVLKNEICYTGGIYDESTGLYYLNARYYDPENGRFLTEDTYRGETEDPDTLHLYTYCKNNPINYVDPSGHLAIEVAVAYMAGTYLIAWGAYYIFTNSYRWNGKTYYKYRRIKWPTIRKPKIRRSKASKKSQKERATERPSWSYGKFKKEGENGKKYAKRLMDEHYGKGKWKRSGKQGDEYSQLKKFGDRGHKK